jgi:GNAT superfamily N-acetyltransferase
LSLKLTVRESAPITSAWIARENGELAGCTSYFPWRLSLDGATVLGALGGDGFVRKTFRRRGLGAQMHDAARADMERFGIHCMFGAPGAMNVTPLKHAGSREVGHVARWVRPMRGVALGIRKAPYDRVVRSADRRGRRAASPRACVVRDRATAGGLRSRRRAGATRRRREAVVTCE